jgi:arsenate reductase
MKKIYHLKTCSTCQRILKEVNAANDFELQDIKTERITAAQLDAMAKMAGNYEALFSRKAMKYRVQGLHEKTLSEADYRELILDEYTFLKRPVIIIDESIFVGNSKKVMAEAVAFNAKTMEA